MTMSDDPNQDGSEFAGDPEEPDPAGAIFDEEIPDGDTRGKDADEKELL